MSDLTKGDIFSLFAIVCFTIAIVKAKDDCAIPLTFFGFIFLALSFL